MKPIIQRIYLLLVSPLVMAASLIALVGFFLAILYDTKVAWSTANSIDQSANAALKGDCDESLSSRAGKARRKGKIWGCVLCKLLDAVVKNHCEDAIELDEGNKD